MNITLNNPMKPTLAVLLTILCLTAARAADKPVLREGKNPAVLITQINPSSDDLQRARRKDPQGETVHVVKLFVTMPPPGAEAYSLYIGEEKIEEYGSFDEGIFFKTYDPRELESRRGKPVRFLHRNEVIDLGVAFPARSTEKLGKLPELQEVLKTK